MNGYTQPPNEAWLKDNESETLLLQFPHGEYAVTVHEEDPEELVGDDDA